MEHSAATDSIPVDPEIQHVAQTLSHWFQTRLQALQQLEQALCSELSLNKQGSVNITDKDRKLLKEHSIQYLANHPIADGCGLIFALSMLDSGRGQLEWWVREDETRFARYSFGVVPGSDRYYDYEQLDWFTKAFVEAKPALVGPYIDYLGVETYVVTVTTPAWIAGELVGAAGTDIQMSDLEEHIMPILQRSPYVAAIVTETGNVMASNSSKFLVGECVHPVPEGYHYTALSPEVFGLRLMYSLTH